VSASCIFASVTGIPEDIQDVDYFRAKVQRNEIERLRRRVLWVRLLRGHRLNRCKANKNSTLGLIAD